MTLARDQECYEVVLPLGVGGLGMLRVETRTGSIRPSTLIFEKFLSGMYMFVIKVFSEIKSAFSFSDRLNAGIQRLASGIFPA